MLNKRGGPNKWGWWADFFIYYMENSGMGEHFFHLLPEKQLNKRVYTFIKHLRVIEQLCRNGHEEQWRARYELFTTQFYEFQFPNPYFLIQIRNINHINLYSLYQSEKCGIRETM